MTGIREMLLMALGLDVFCSVFIISLLTSPTSAIKMHDDNKAQQGDDNAAAASGDFPIAYPPIQYGKDGKASVNKTSGANQCLFYAEGISVVVFNSQGKRHTAWADFHSYTDEVPKYSAEMTCHGSQRMGESFEITIDVNGKADGVLRSEIGNKDAKKLFSVDGVSFTLNFNYTRPGYWELTGATIPKLKVVGSGSLDFLKNTLDVSDKWVVDEASIASSNINGFKDYSFACGRTNPVVWVVPGKDKDKKESPEYAVGISLTNVQFQPFNATFMVDGKDGNSLKFGWKVNDCEGLFTIGTWMGLIVALLLIGVLSFGFLMLNSVQTMDRFDDPKQKQLIINAKE